MIGVDSVSETSAGGHSAFGRHRLQFPRQRQHQRRGQIIIKSKTVFQTKN